MPDFVSKFTDIEKLLEAETQNILDMISHEPGSAKSPFVMLSTDVDISSRQASTAVAVTSNEYAKATRLAGICRAMCKVAEARYKQKFKTALALPGAKNADEREANATAAAADEYNSFVICQALVELTESWEQATRIASESSRKISGTVEQAGVANRRGSYLTADEPITKGRVHEMEEPW